LLSKMGNLQSRLLLSPLEDKGEIVLTKIINNC
jgi:hypothetical protein